MRASGGWISWPREAHANPVGRPVFYAVPPLKVPMNEDERRDLVESVAEAHTRLSDAAYALRRRLTSKAPATKAAVRAEQESFRLLRELQRLDLADPEISRRREALAKRRRRRMIIDLDRLR